MLSVLSSPFGADRLGSAAISSASSSPRPAAPGATGSTSAARRAALAIAQRHDLPDLLARVLAGRGVEIDDVARHLDPTVRRADARSERR